MKILSDLFKIKIMFFMRIKFWHKSEQTQLNTFYVEAVEIKCNIIMSHNKNVIS